MNSSQFKKLIALLLLVGGIGLLFLSRDRNAWQKAEKELGGKVIPEFPLNDITAISIKDADAEITVAKKEGIWTVSDRWDYPADFSKVGDLLQNIWDLKIARNIKAGPSQFGRLELVTPGEGANSGTLLTFKKEGNAEAGSLLLGKEHMRKSEAPSQFGGGGDFPDGRYVLPNDNGDAIALVSETFSGVDVDPNAWLDKGFVKVEKLQSAEVTHPTPEDSWSVSRETETADMVLADLPDGEELDSTKSYSLKNILSSPSFNDIADPNAENDGQDGGITAQLNTFDGFTYVLEIGAEDADTNYPVNIKVSATLPEAREKAEDETEEDTARLDKEFEENKKTLTEKLAKEKAFESWTYLVSKWTVDALLNKRSDLIKQPEEAEGTEDALGGGPAGPPLPMIPDNFQIPTPGSNPTLEIKPEALEIEPVEVEPEPEVEAPTEEAVKPEASAESSEADSTDSTDSAPEEAEDVEEAIESVTNPLPTP